MTTVPKPGAEGTRHWYVWDAWNRLVEVKDGEATVARYAYDGLNHRITKTVGATIQHAYYNTGWQLLEVRETTNPEAETTAAEAHHYVYDAWNRLTQVWEDTNEDGDLNGEPTDTHVLTCRYDGLGQRIQKIVEGDPDVTYDYYYNMSWQILEVHRSDYTYAPYEQYVWDIRYIDAPVLRDRDTADSGTLDETLYFCNDANMNVTAVVDTDGDVVERYAYDPYGQVTILNGADGADPDVDGETVFEWDPDADGVSDVDNRTLYAGYHLDTETGLYHVRYRTYHPTLGRWLTRDPIDYADSMSLYQYGLSKPTRMIDPEGLRCGDCCPPTDAEDNFYKIEISKFMVLPHNTRPCDVDWDNALLALKGIELLNIVKDVGGGIAGGLAKSGEVAGAASGGLKGAVSRGFKIGKNIGMKDACLEEIEEMKKVMVTEKESWGNRGGVEMYIWLKYESCDPCTSWNPFLWFGATEYEMRTHETDEFRCTRRIIRPRTNSTPPPGPILSPYRDIEDAKAHLPDCMEEAEEALRAGRIK